MRARLTLTLETPFLPGSADPNKVDLDWPLRPSEVKGIWRWWARAFVAGVLFEKGYLCDCRENRMLKEQARLISLIVGKGLGLGYAGPMNSQASEFEIFIKPINNPKITKIALHCTTRQSSSIEYLQRVKLLLLSKTIYNNFRDKNVTVTFSNEIKDDEIVISKGLLDKKGAELRDGDYVLVSTDKSCLKLKIKIINNNNIFIKLNEKYKSEKIKQIKVYKELEYIDPKSNFAIDIEIRYKQRDRGESKEEVKNKMIASLGILLVALTLTCFGKGGRKGLGCFSIKNMEIVAESDKNNIASELKNIFNGLNSSDLNMLSAIKNVKSHVEKVIQNFIDDKSQCNDQSKLPPMPAVTFRYADSSSKLPLFRIIIAHRGGNATLLETLHNFFLRAHREKYVNVLSKRMSWILGLPRTGLGQERRPSPIFIAIHGDKAYITVFTSCDWPSKSVDNIINVTSIAINELKEYMKKNKIYIKIDTGDITL